MSPERLAVKTARRSKHPLWKLGAVLVSPRDGILDAKSNLPSWPGYGGVCAEERILRHPPRTARGGSILYVARVRRVDGKPAIARPCPKCQRIIERSGVREVYYTDEYGEWQRMPIR